MSKYKIIVQPFGLTYYAAILKQRYFIFWWKVIDTDVSEMMYTQWIMDIQSKYNIPDKSVKYRLNQLITH